MRLGARKVLGVVAHTRGSNDTSLIEGYKELGYEIRIVNTREWITNNKLHERIFRKLASKPFPQMIARFNEKIIEAAEEFRPDIVFIAKGIWVTVQTVHYLRSQGCVVIHWHPDDAFNPENTSAVFAEAMPHYDLIVTPKTFNIEEYKRHGANRVVYVPYAFDPAIHYPVEERLFAQHDVVFVGTKRNKRVGELSRLHREGVDLKIYGGQWHKLPVYKGLRKACAFQEVYAEQMSSVFASSKIVLGFLNAENRDKHTARTFEVPACKGFYLSERTEEQIEFLREDIEAAYFGNEEELLEKIRFYTAHDSLRDKIKQAGYERVHELKATYSERVKLILNELNH